MIATAETASAYCYLFVPQRWQVMMDVKKRLQVLQHFTALGAGFLIASHDMESRSAGNLFGPDRSGRIAAVGLDLYAEIMDEAVRELSSEPPCEDDIYRRPAQTRTDNDEHGPDARTQLSALPRTRGDRTRP